MYTLCSLWRFSWIVLIATVSTGISIPLAADAKPLIPRHALPLLLADADPDCAIASLEPEHPVAVTLAALYASNGFQPLWVESRRYESLISAIDGLVLDGLDPLDYRVVELREQRDIQRNDHNALICRELLASQSYLMALYHLSHGRWDGAVLEPLWRAPDPDNAHDEPPEVAAPAAEGPRQLESLTHRETLARLETLASSGLADIAAAFHRARPGFVHYHQLRHAYGQWRDWYRFADWPQVPAGPALKPGMEDERTPLVRQRLQMEGFLPAPGSDGDLGHPDTGIARYDDTLAAAVKQFQRRHGLKIDAVVGRETLREMNVPRAFRYDQIRANLERLRWLWREMEFNTVLVDIAGAEVTYLRDNAPLWRSRVQVGTSARPTPVLKSRITHLTFNPTWTVPPTIYRKDKLPEIRRDIGYLAKNRIRVLDANGRELDPYSINWNNPGAIRLRQDAGPANALGLVAIRFPNPFAVYLHDTPSQKLFANQQRATSSGCVRVEGAMDLSSILFEGVSDEKRLQIEAIKASGRTRNVSLPTPVPIVLAYWTVDVDEQGELAFRPDIYRRDESLVKALRAAEN